MRYALGLQYDGRRYAGWQVQPEHSGVRTLQTELETALGHIASQRTEVFCAGRTDAGVHALQQVVHFDTTASRPNTAWVRGVNAALPKDISVRWVQAVDDTFHARHSAVARRYVYVLVSDSLRPALARQHIGWTHYPLALAPMLEAAQLLLGTHDFSSFRASSCQAASPVRTLTELAIHPRGKTFYIIAQANGFLHHMMRNIVGALVAVGAGRQSVAEFASVFGACDRTLAAPTFWPNGLYFCGAVYPNYPSIPAPLLNPFDASTDTWPWV